jgi:hypothetical protein
MPQGLKAQTEVYLRNQQGRSRPLELGQVSAMEASQSACARKIPALVFAPPYR